MIQISESSTEMKVVFEIRKYKSTLLKVKLLSVIIYFY